jgi:hypothetical protein
MTDAQNTVWRRVGDAARALGDAVGTPGGAAPGRAARGAAQQRERF